MTNGDVGNRCFAPVARLRGKSQEKIYLYVAIVLPVALLRLNVLILCSVIMAPSADA